MESNVHSRKPSAQPQGDDVSPEPRPQKKQRIHYLDNIRTALTVVVIYQHTASAYGADGSWLYKSPYHTRSFPLIIFKAINRTYLMATFFYLSGYFSALTARKRPSRTAFLKDKALRLGLPTLLSTLLSEPLQLALLSLIRDGQRPTWALFTTYWASLRGVKGPVWYTALLLLLDTTYITLRTRPTATTTTTTSSTPPTRTGLLAATLALSALSFATRLAYPLTTTLTPLSTRPGFMPQYLFFYALGTRHTRFPLPRDAHALLAALSATAAATLLLLLLLAAPSTSRIPALAALRGGWNVAAAAYAVWHEATGLLAFSALAGLFARTEGLRRDWGPWARCSSYAAFLVHAPVLVAVMAGLDGRCCGAAVGAVGMTAAVGTVGAVVSWGLGWCLARVPGVRRCVV